MCSDFVVEIFWTEHAVERFAERALLYGLGRSEIEFLVLKQFVRIERGFDEKYRTCKFETIGLAGKEFFTIQKAERKGKIIIITLWNSSQKEVDLWLSKQK